MPRKSRERSDSQIYHVMLRGVNKQDIFWEEKDYYKFLKDLKLVKELYQLSIYAYCLMPNHVHLLIKDKEDLISQAMHSIEIRYSSYINKKYERVGHLFQSRYLSKPVENKEYLLKVQRYIHQNPSKAGIGSMQKYKWSSYHEYIYQEKIADSIPILTLFGKDRWSALRGFIQYHQEDVVVNKETEEEFEFLSRTSMTDEELIGVIKQELQIKSIYDIQQYQKDIRNNYIKEILKIKGTNTKQIARVTGYSVRTIQRVKSEKG